MCIFNFVGRKLRGILRQELWLFYKENVMSTIDEVTTSVTVLNSSLVEVKTKLDVIAALVTELKGNQVASQEQVDTLATAVASAQESVADISAAEDAIK